MASPDASVSGDDHGLNAYAYVWTSESERMPGKRNRSHVPPIASRASSTVKVTSGSASCRCTAVPMPEIPAPTTTTSTHSRLLHRRREATPATASMLARRRRSYSSASARSAAPPSPSNDEPCMIASALGREVGEARGSRAPSAG